MTDRPILLVEDNPDDVALMLHALKSNQTLNPVVIAEDGEEALHHLQRAEIDPHCRTPALILLDLNVPKLSGLDVLRQIRSNERTRLVPVVILTSSLERQDRLNAYECGANSYIRKPVDFEEFVKVTGELSHYWLSLNQPALDA